MKGGDEKPTAVFPTQQKLIGDLEQYVPGEDFEEYLERAENYYELNGIVDIKFKKRLIIHAMGAETYKQLKKLMTPGKPNDENNTYDIRTEKLKSYYCRKKNEIVEHFAFNKRNQQQGESVLDYAVELQALAKKCEFGSFLDKALRDRFVAGLLNEGMQEKLLNEDAKMKFEDAVKKATTSETSKREVKHFHSKINSGVISKMSNNSNYVARKDTKVVHRQEQEQQNQYRNSTNNGVSRNSNFNNRAYFQNNKSNSQKSEKKNHFSH